MTQFRAWRGAGRCRRAALVLALLGAACSASGCGAAESLVVAAKHACSARVIVRFATAPDEAVLADIERAHAVELGTLGAITGDTRVFLLRAAGLDADCRAAVERLESDARVRSVDLDARRVPHGGQPKPKEERP